MDNKFSSSINDIDERVFEKYYAFERKLDIKRAHKAKMKAKFFAAAACLTIFACIGVTVILPAMRKDNPDDPLSIPSDTYTETEHSFFTDTVHSSGENVEDDTNESAMETAEETVVEIVTEAEGSYDDTAENAVTGEIETEDTAPYEILVDDNMVFIKDENGCYVVIDDLYKYQTSLGGMQLAYIPFDSIEEFYNTVNSGVLDNSQKELIAWAVRVYSNNRTCDFKNLYEPILPQGCDVLSVGWYVSYYSFYIKKSNEFLGYIQILNEEGYNQLYVRDFENIIGENDTVTHVENIDGIETIYYYRSSHSYKNVRYTLQSGNKTVIVDKKFDMGVSEIVPLDIKLYCVENGNYYVVNLKQIYEDLSDELLREFGLKRYVNEECNHIWKLESEKDSKYKCSKCNAIHFCTNPEDLEKVGNLNESTLIYRCRICGSEHLTTDPDSIKPDDEIDSPLGSMLKFEIIDEKLICQTVPSASRIVYSHISDMSKETVYDNRYDIINVIFQSMDGKTAILDTYECEFLHYIYLFDSENDSWSYKVMLCDCGAVTIIDNEGFLCSVKISDEELQMILDSLNFF